MRLLALLCALLLAAPVAGQTVRGCGRHGAVVSAAEAARPRPALTGRVIDQAALLSPRVERRLVRELEALERATTDELVVVTVSALEGEPIERLALRLGNGWGIGKAALNNGVLLIVAPGERVARIDVGCGLEGLLTDERAQQIMDNVLIPHFAQSEFEQGVEAGVRAIGTLLRSDRRRPRPWTGPPS